VNLLTTHYLYDWSYAMSNIIQIMTYIKLLTNNAYDTQDIFIFHISLLGLILEDNLQLLGT